MITDKTIEQLQEAVETKIITVGDKTFVTREVFDPIIAPHQPKPLTLHSLTALADYIKDVLEGDVTGEIPSFVHVAEPERVVVRSALYSDFRQRETLVEAVYETPKFPYESFMPIENFIIFLSSRFVDTSDRKKVLSIVGNIRDEKVVTANDDGLTQTVTAKTGIARVAEVEVPNPVYLAPFRTFSEVDQPVSPFLLRMKSGREGELPSAGLFEADGGAWKNEARQNIRAWLTTALGDDFAILA